MGRKRNRKNPAEKFSAFNASAKTAQDVYSDYLTRMCDIYMNLYLFENVPETIDIRFLVKTMMQRPGIAVFRDEIMDEVLALPFNAFSRPDIYNNPVDINVYSANGYTRTLHRGEFAIIWSSYMRFTPFVTIELFAQKMAQVQNTILVNLNNQKTPKIIKTSANASLSTENILKDIEGYVPVVKVDETFNTDNLSSIDITVPYIVDKLDIHKNMVWNEFLTWCGIENGNMDKKERMVASEVMANYGNVEMGRNTGLAARKEGLRDANRLFGLNMQVRFNSEIPTMLNSPELLSMEQYRRI